MLLHTYKQSQSPFQFIQQKNALVYNYNDAKPNIKKGDVLLALAVHIMTTLKQKQFSFCYRFSWSDLFISSWF